MPSMKPFLLLALAALAPWSPVPADQPAAAASPAAAPAAASDPREEIARRIPGASADQLHAAPIPGLWEYTHGGDIAYVTADGRYAIAGDLYDLKSNANLTEAHRREVRMKLLAQVSEKEMLVFGPKDPKYTVTVFTDVDCPYCRELHSQIGVYNRLGIRVRYLLYPRTGPNTPSWTKAEQVWCAADPNDALTRAKLGQVLADKPCARNPVAMTYALGREFAIDGTPAIVMTNGELLPGYLPPDVLLKHLQEELR
ncbi:MAG TPA: DsbC family protein [Steroidobacteraceae bacterium]|nr:DsbC family protein [Steroidobacteraceae bacterium]